MHTFAGLNVSGGLVSPGTLKSITSTTRDRPGQGRGARSVVAASLLVLMLIAGTSGLAREYAAMQAKMIAEIEADMRDVARYTGRDKLAPQVIRAMKAVPRHEFVADNQAPVAYANVPLPIGRGQTISQPFIVALMTDLMAVSSDDKVLEVGTGSGYQAAVLAELVSDVISIEIIPELSLMAKNRLRDQGYTNIRIHTGDGTLGWPAASPYDAIIVTAAGEEVPPALKAQLKPGGRLVIPVGPEGGVQMLKVITRGPADSFSERDVLPVRFVPITH